LALADGDAELAETIYRDIADNMDGAGSGNTMVLVEALLDDGAQNVVDYSKPSLSGQSVHFWKIKRR